MANDLIAASTPEKKLSWAFRVSVHYYWITVFTVFIFAQQLHRPVCFFFFTKATDKLTNKIKLIKMIF